MDNAIDEAMAGFVKHHSDINADGSVTSLMMWNPRDKHKQPVIRLETVLTVCTPEKIRGGGYKVSEVCMEGKGGERLVYKLVAEVCAMKRYRQEYHCAPLADVKAVGEAEGTGTKITFYLIQKSFKTVIYF
jgi:DNA gyrase subunit B